MCLWMSGLFTKKYCRKVPTVFFLSQIRLEVISDTGRKFVDVIQNAFLQVYMAIHAANGPVFVNVVLCTDVGPNAQSFFFAGAVALFSVFCLILSETKTGNQFNFLIAAERQIAQSIDAVALNA